VTENLTWRWNARQMESIAREMHVTLQFACLGSLQQCSAVAPTHQFPSRGYTASKKIHKQGRTTKRRQRTKPTAIWSCPTQFSLRKLHRTLGIHTKDLAVRHNFSERKRGRKRRRQAFACIYFVFAGQNKNRNRKNNSPAEPRWRLLRRLKFN